MIFYSFYPINYFIIDSKIKKLPSIYDFPGVDITSYPALGTLNYFPKILHEITMTFPQLLPGLFDDNKTYSFYPINYFIIDSKIKKFLSIYDFLGVDITPYPALGTLNYFPRILYETIMTFPDLLPGLFDNDTISTYNFDFIPLIFINILLISILLTLVQKNPIYSILFLIFSFLIFSIFILYLGIEFISLLFLIIYVGAISILFLFVFMMLNIKYISLNNKKDYTFISIIILLFIILFNFLILYNYKDSFFDYYILNYTYFNWLDIFLYKKDVESIGFTLFNNFLIEFCLAGILLLVAMIGSISLVISTNKRAKSQSIDKQLKKNSNKVKNFFIKI